MRARGLDRVIAAMLYSGWVRSSHRSVATCNDCHTYLDFVEAENSSGFHAPGEAQRILAESVNCVRKGQLALRDLKGHREAASP